MANAVAVVLAAGKSTRMKSDVPKVLHDVCGRPMIEYVLDAARDAGAIRLVVVVGHRAETVKATLSHHDDVDFALQAEQLGTGHAVMVCEQHLQSHDGPVLILAGDTPLLKGDSLTRLIDDLTNTGAASVVGTANTRANEGLGRVVREENGDFARIVEHKDASPDELAITEINTGCYAFDCRGLLRALKQIRPENQQAEYYLTDCPSILKAEGQRVLASCSLDINEAMGVNTRVQLAEVTSVIQAEHQQKLMINGVTIISPGQTWIDSRATIGRETVILPGTTILGAARIGSGCRIGPQAVVEGDVKLPNNSVLGPGDVLR